MSDHRYELIEPVRDWSYGPWRLSHPTGRLWLFWHSDDDDNLHSAVSLGDAIEQIHEREDRP